MVLDEPPAMASGMLVSQMACRLVSDPPYVTAMSLPPTSRFSQCSGWPMSPTNWGSVSRDRHTTVGVVCTCTYVDDHLGGNLALGLAQSRVEELAGLDRCKATS